MYETIFHISVIDCKKFITVYVQDHEKSVKFKTTLFLCCQLVQLWWSTYFLGDTGVRVQDPDQTHIQTVNMILIIETLKM